MLTSKYHSIKVLEACALLQGLSGLPDHFSEGHLFSIT